MMLVSSSHGVDILHPHTSLAIERRPMQKEAEEKARREREAVEAKRREEEEAARIKAQVGVVCARFQLGDD